MALRIRRELPSADEEEASQLYSDLLRFWSAGLLNHFEVENSCMLARLAKREDEGLAQAGRLQREHREMIDLVEEMRAATGTDQRRDALTRFGDQLEQHIRWEERELFEWMQTQFTEEELDAIGAYLQQHLPDQPVPAPMPHTP